MRLLLAAITFALIANPVCAQPNDLIGKAKTLGVLILGGHEIELARVGAMVFWNKRSVVAAPDDALAEAAFQEIQSQLSQEQRLSVSRVPVNADVLPKLAEKAFAGATGFFGPSIAALKEDLAPYRSTCQCDALLVLATSRGQMDPNSNQTFKGFAWVGFSAFNDEVRKSAAVAYVKLFLIDAATGDVLGAWGNSTDEGTILHSVPVTSDQWPKEMNALASESWPDLVSAFRMELRKTLRRPLFRFGLKPSCGIHFYEVDNPPISRNSSQNPFAPTSPPTLPDGAHPSKCL